MSSNEMTARTGVADETAPGVAQGEGAIKRMLGVPANEAVRATIAAVPRTLDSAQIRDAVQRFMNTPNTDTDARVSFFANSVIYEEPAGLTLATNKTELHRFFRDVAGSGLVLQFFPEKLIVSGDEAIQTARVLFRIGPTAPVLMFLHIHFVFDRDGLVRHLRTFFDDECISPVFREGL